MFPGDPFFFPKIPFFAIIRLQGELYEANEVPKYNLHPAGVAELEDALDLKSNGG